jgi:hypothetical protein
VPALGVPRDLRIDRMGSHFDIHVMEKCNRVVHARIVPREMQRRSTCFGHPAR